MENVNVVTYSLIFIQDLEKQGFFENNIITPNSLYKYILEQSANNYLNSGNPHITAEEFSECFEMCVKNIISDKLDEMIKSGIVSVGIAPEGDMVYSLNLDC